MSRLVRSSPTKVCHIPQAVDYFLSEEMLVSWAGLVWPHQSALHTEYCFKGPLTLPLASTYIWPLTPPLGPPYIYLAPATSPQEKDSPELPHLLTWAPCSPLRALSLFCKSCTIYYCTLQYCKL